MQKKGSCTDQTKRTTLKEFQDNIKTYPADTAFWLGKCDGSWTRKSKGFNQAYYVTESVENLTGSWEKQKDGSFRWLEKCADSKEKIAYTVNFDDIRAS